jgi:hypothetical protein
MEVDGQDVAGYSADVTAVLHQAGDQAYTLRLQGGKWKSWLNLSASRE